MTWIILIATAALGAIFGSFLNALSFRIGTGYSALSLKGGERRSRCMRCNHVLHAEDLVPIISYIILRGRCRYCGSRISWQYPVVEALAALLAVAAYLAYEPLEAVFWFVVSLVLLFIAVYDLRHRIIPWGGSLTLGVLALIHVWWSFNGDWISVAAGPLLALPLLLLFWFSGGRWMGFGDWLLELGLGWLLGLTAGLTALLLSFWIGAAVGIALLVAKRGVTIKSEIPFAPFLIVGAAVAHFFHVDFFPQLPLLFL